MPDSASLKRCAITGAADGIGRALMHRYAAAGYALLGVDINAERAAVTQQELTEAGAEATFTIADLTLN